MRYLTRLILPSWILLTFLLASAAPGGAAGIGRLLPHRGAYVLSLGHGQTGSDVVDVQGVMTYEFADACGGWTTTQKARMRFFYDDGHTSNLGWNLNSWESKDGKRYRFFMRNFADNTVTAQFRGEAEMPASGQPGVVSFDQPGRKTLTLPSGTLFPAGHSLALLRHLAEGD